MVHYRKKSFFNCYFLQFGLKNCIFLTNIGSIYSLNICMLTRITLCFLVQLLLIFYWIHMTTTEEKHIKILIVFYSYIPELRWIKSAIKNIGESGFTSLSSFSYPCSKCNIAGVCGTTAAQRKQLKSYGKCEHVLKSIL